MKDHLVRSSWSECLSSQPAASVRKQEVAEFDAAFVRRLRAGERGAFEALVRAFGPKVRRVAMTFFASPFEQEDATQEVFLLLYRQREAIDPLRAEKLSSFIGTVARRKMIDLLRSRGAAPPADELREDDWRDETQAPLQHAQDQELTALLEIFESKLKPSYRSFFHAVFIEGRDFDQACEELKLGRLRARYLKRVLLTRLRNHPPLAAYLGRARG